MVKRPNTNIYMMIIINKINKIICMSLKMSKNVSILLLESDIYKTKRSDEITYILWPLWPLHDIREEY